MNMPLHTAAENGNPKRKALIAALRDLAGRERGALAAQQNEALRLLERQDLLWYLLLQSLATWGRGGGCTCISRGRGIRRTTRSRRTRLSMSATT